MYNINSVLIAGILFVSMVLAIEMGYRLGIKAQSSANDAFKTHVNTVGASILGILALLLGFTFSLSLQRFDSRSQAVVEEANAIGTTYLRSQLLPASVRSDIQKLLREYVDARIQASAISLDGQAERETLLTKAKHIQSALWDYAQQAAEEEPSPVTTGLFIQSLNELIDNFGKRNAALNRHVPEVVLLLLYGTFLMAGAVVGYGSGVAGYRTSVATYIMVVLIMVLVFIVIDLDRPRRGLIQVDQSPLIELQTDLSTNTNAPPP